MRAWVGSMAPSVTRDVSLTGYDAAGSPIAGAKQVATVVGAGDLPDGRRVVKAVVRAGKRVGRARVRITAEAGP